MATGGGKSLTSGKCNQSNETDCISNEKGVQITWPQQRFRKPTREYPATIDG